MKLLDNTSFIKKCVQLVCTLLFSNLLFSQDLLNSFPIEENNLTPVITNEDRYLFFDSDNTDEYIPIYEVVGAKLICHNIKNIKINNKYATYPMNALYSNDTFLVSYGNVLALATKTDNGYEFEQAFVLYDSVTNISTYTIVGYDNGIVVLADYEWYNRKLENYQNYYLISYDIEKEKIINTRSFNWGNVIFYNMFANANLFSWFDEKIAMLHPLKPITYIMDFNLNIKDSIVFNIQSDYTIGEKILNNIDKDFISQCLISHAPKNMIYILVDVLDFYNKYYYNIKQHFIDKENILICYKEATENDSGEKSLAVLNLKNKTSKYLFSFVYDSPLGDIYHNEQMPLFRKGILFKQEEKLTEDEQDIIYSLDMYYSKSLDLGSE